jgi:hypothetical protein
MNDHVVGNHDPVNCSIAQTVRSHTLCPLSRLSLQQLDRAHRRLD